MGELLRRGADKTIRDWDRCTPAGNLDVPKDFSGCTEKKNTRAQARLSGYG